MELALADGLADGLPPALGLIESFNDSLREECLDEEIFDSLADARHKLSLSRYDYNNVRPHSTLGSKTQASDAHSAESSAFVYDPAACRSFPKMRRH